MRIFFFSMKVLMVVQLYSKAGCLGKIWFLNYGPKELLANQIARHFTI